MNRARNTVVVLLSWCALILIFLAFVWLLNREHAGVNAGLPLVQRAAPASNFPRNNMLFSPCPLTPRNLPRFTDDEEDRA